MNKKLSDFELDVMSIFWRVNKASAPQVHELITENKEVSYSTVKTIVDRLEQKSAIKRESLQGRTIFYAPAIKQESLSTPLLKGFLRRLFSNRPQQLIAQLIENEELNNDDIEKLEKMLAEKKSTQRKSKK
ncbi:BlaI/MecI/CopY family transcriptional regulator [Agaribacter marinus]|uniref:Transcriptional regulator n=1 Tax=Agaribacter marinus TaxID=1431249 RepID=A0AA37SZH1_9ALTE|nr:BlaI/MecI/CopY family transcriptional regulator [Agaribacter marinus]GLR72598.1 hypothetical protein GCM10007852_35060 [Agaribacter marinus]